MKKRVIKKKASRALKGFAWAYHNLPMSVELKAAIGVVLRRHRVNLEGESK